MNRTLKLIIIAVLVMLVLPWVILAGAQAEAMGLIFILLYAGYPIYSAYLGWQAGKEIKKNWFLPILSPGLFLLCVVVFFTWVQKQSIVLCRRLHGGREEGYGLFFRERRDP